MKGKWGNHWGGNACPPPKKKRGKPRFRGPPTETPPDPGWLRRPSQPKSPMQSPSTPVLSPYHGPYVPLGVGDYFFVSQKSGEGTVCFFPLFCLFQICFWSEFYDEITSLKTNSSPLKIGPKPKKESSWPTVHIPPWQNGNFFNLFYKFCCQSWHTSCQSSSYHHQTQTHALQHTWIEIRKPRRFSIRG